MATGLGLLRKQAVNSHVSLFLSTLGNAFICSFLIFFSTSMSRQPLIFCSQGLPLMDICACACIHACLWRPKLYVEFLLQLHSPVFLRQGLSLNLELANWARLAGQQPWGSSCRHPLVLGLQASAAPDVLFGCWCSKLRSFCLCSKHVADWAVFSPRTFSCTRSYTVWPLCLAAFTQHTYSYILRFPHLSAFINTSHHPEDGIPISRHTAF